MRFFVLGNPIPKQSFRYSKFGGYTDPRVKTWQDTVAMTANMYFDKPIEGKVKMTLDFQLGDARPKDNDNLSKCVGDALNGIAYIDDKQVVDLHITKCIIRTDPGVWIEVEEL